MLVHGILDSSDNMEEAAQWVRGALAPGTYVRSVEIGNGIADSLTKPMEWQLARLAESILADGKLAKGFNMIGYSQGALLARAFVQRWAAAQATEGTSAVGRAP